MILQALLIGVITMVCVATVFLALHVAIISPWGRKVDRWVPKAKFFEIFWAIIIVTAVGYTIVAAFSDLPSFGQIAGLK